MCERQQKIARSYRIQNNMYNWTAPFERMLERRQEAVGGVPIESGSYDVLCLRHSSPRIDNRIYEIGVLSLYHKKRSLTRLSIFPRT